ncbi:ATP-binding protein [Massilia sp. CCM 9210]|uniref:hybrid sensor histidine kinase/response regulator n=1 Tax=Massilia scottii TaxID=3057166 RepID=UPI00279685AE|nr:ATP-binding protein [Massilia sp. CCM 9210]MDQ1812895.1 ATP-binding protein [Massilia sp. CCM 9210]
MRLTFDFLSNGGELGALMRVKDWSTTPLGPPEHWPTLLKSTIRLILTSRHPMFLWWGGELVQFYNDAYRLTMGPERHPGALGQRGRDCWEEIWPIIGPQIEMVMAGNGSTWHEDQLVPVTRHGKREDVWWTYGYSPIEDHDGVHGVLVVCNDVTAQHNAKAALERMNLALTEQIAQREQAQRLEAIQTGQRLRAEQALREQREAETTRLRSLFEQAHGFMCILRGPEHVFEFANSAYLRLVGARPLIGKTVREALPDVVGQGFFELLDAVYASGKPYKAGDLRIELRMAPDSAPIQAYIDFVYQPIIEDGSVSGIFVQGFDVTDRTMARQALQRSELRLKEGMKVARMVVWDWDLASNEVLFSDNAPELFGENWTDMRSLWDFLDPADLQRMELARSEAIKSNGSYGEVVRLRRPDNGQTVWLQVYATVVPDHAGHARCIRGVSIDVSARKRAEESLREAGRHKDEFLAMLSHELRNPLAPIRSAAHLLAMAPDNASRVKMSSVIIERQVNHMTSLINDLLDVSRVNTGLVVLDKQLIDLHQVVLESVEQTQPLIAERGHVLSLDVPGEGEVAVWGDRKRLVQVLTNLLHNAAKYTQPGGRIMLEISHQADTVELHVRDNGIGLDAVLMPHIFDLFTQEKRSSDRSQGGLGLGLALVRSLVSLHGGHVTAASPGLGEGATFSVYLQKHAAPSGAGASGRGPGYHAGEGLRLMLVDDNKDAANAMAMVLESAGHVVMVEHDPHRALESVGSFGPDACLLDIGLPGMDGNELARRLRTSTHARAATLIAVTGYGNKYDKASAVQAGFDHYFVKPANTAELIGVLARIKPAAGATQAKPVAAGVHG